MEKTKQALIAIQNIKTHLQQNRWYFILVLFTTGVLFFTSILYYKLTSSFDFVDEYNNIVSGYFVLQGRTLYEEVFFNRQMLPAYLSGFIQIITKPDTLYSLILTHRIFVLLYSLLFDVLIMVRLKTIGILFVLLYEVNKYYAFGYLFQAESLIVYPLIYMAGVALEGYLLKKTPSRIDIIISSLFAWYVLFMREPYIPLVLALYGLIFLRSSINSRAISSVTIGVLTCIILVITPLPEYIYQLINVNRETIVQQELFGSSPPVINLFKSVGYPLYLYTNITISHFHIVLMSISALFLILLVRDYVIRKDWKFTVTVIILLGLAAIRPQPPGNELYGMYKMLPWFSLFILITVFLCVRFFIQQKKDTLWNKILFFSVTIIILFSHFSPTSYTWKTLGINKQEEFSKNYSRYYSIGETIHILSDKSSNLFIEGYDSLIYWQSKVQPTYPYVFYYYPAQGNVAYFQTKKEQMYRTNPPTFYYKDCVVDKNKYNLPSFLREHYVELINIYTNNGSCLYIAQDHILGIEEDRWEKIRALGYSLNHYDETKL